MKKIFLLLLMFIATSSYAQVSLSQPPSGNNQKCRTTQFIGPVEITITYSSPDVHGANGEDRKGKIWGGLVTYGFTYQGFGVKAAPWRAGANENTTIYFSNDVLIDGKEIKAGTYGLFLVLAEKGPWTWIFSKNSTSWGSFSYTETEDALRVETNPQPAPYTEWLTYGFDARQVSSAIAYLQWEEKRVPFKIEARVGEIYVARNRNELRSQAGYDYRNWSLAAQINAQYAVDLNEALTWADKAMDPSIGGVENFTTLNAKAVVLYKMTRYDEAEQIMDKAIRLPGTPAIAIHQYGRILLQGGKKEKAIEVFQYNAKVNPGDKFTTNVGLARAYTALGDKPKAISHWQLAIQNIPESRRLELPAYEQELQKLKQ